MNSFFLVLLEFRNFELYISFSDHDDNFLSFTVSVSELHEAIKNSTITPFRKSRTFSIKGVSFYLYSSSFTYLVDKFNSLNY